MEKPKQLSSAVASEAGNVFKTSMSKREKNIPCVKFNVLLRVDDNGLAYRLLPGKIRIEKGKRNCCWQKIQRNDTLESSVASALNDGSLFKDDLSLCFCRHTLKVFKNCHSKCFGTFQIQVFSLNQNLLLKRKKVLSQGKCLLAVYYQPCQSSFIIIILHDQPLCATSWNIVKLSNQRPLTVNKALVY